MVPLHKAGTEQRKALERIRLVGTFETTYLRNSIPANVTVAKSGFHSPCRTLLSIPMSADAGCSRQCFPAETHPRSIRTQIVCSTFAASKQTNGLTTMRPVLSQGKDNIAIWQVP